MNQKPHVNTNVVASTRQALLNAEVREQQWHSGESS